MSDSERTQQIKATIRGHLEQVGATQWKAVRLQLPGISDATFWRYVKAVREEADEKPGTAVPINRVEEQTSGTAVRSLGSFPEFYTPLKKARLYEELLADAGTMKAQALDHRGKITNWRMYDKSIQHRERLLSQQGEVIQFFQSQERFEQFFAQVMDIVMADLPKDVVTKVMERLNEFRQQELGGTPGF